MRKRRPVRRSRDHLEEDGAQQAVAARVVLEVELVEALEGAAVGHHRELVDGEVVGLDRQPRKDVAQPARVNISEII